MLKGKYLFFFTLFISFITVVKAQQLVLPGDHPDPTVVKIGDTYWASSTTSNWFPAYPLYQSKDLVNWKLSGHVFDTMPAWADYYFWAPEMVHERGKTYLYYTAHKKGGNLCVGVASANHPAGPYKDHGPLICQTDGSIDAFEIRDTDGKLYLIWKEDGNSVGKPTPNWIQEINEERTQLLGEKKELFRNDAAWESNLVEGISMIRHGDYFYAFYAGAGCCGSGCSYQGGVARAKNLFGPWEKYAQNPNLVSTDKWICPGHGTPVMKDGRYYFMYHAYNAKSKNFVGRQGMLIELTFRPDGWIDFIYEDKKGAIVPAKLTDNFNGKKLSPLWHWSVFQQFDHTVNRGKLSVSALPTPTGAFIGQTTYQLNYDAEVTVFPRKSSAAAGIALIGDERNLVTINIKKGIAEIIMVKDGVDSLILSREIPAVRKATLTMQVREEAQISFSLKTGNKTYPFRDIVLNGSYLPPWDRGLRVGLTSKGTKDEKSVFDHFVINILGD